MQRPAEGLLTVTPTEEDRMTAQELTAYLAEIDEVIRRQAEAALAASLRVARHEAQLVAAREMTPEQVNTCQHFGLMEDDRANPDPANSRETLYRHLDHVCALRNVVARLLVEATRREEAGS